MAYAVDFKDVSTMGLESSPFAEALAGVRAHEARYFRNKYDHVFTTVPAAEAGDAIERVHRILAEERNIVIASSRRGCRVPGPRRTATRLVDRSPRTSSI